MPEGRLTDEIFADIPEEAAMYVISNNRGIMGAVS